MKLSVISRAGVLAVLFSFWVCLGAGVSPADLRPEKVRVADSRKSQTYFQDGMVVGGDRTVNEVIVKDIRRASNNVFERIVIDLEGNRNGESVAIARPPYFQVAVTPDEKRAVITLYGKTRLVMDPKKIQTAFKKSTAVKAVQLLPVVEEDSWSFALEFKGDYPVEVFELVNPVRIIIDILTRK